MIINQLLGNYLSISNILSKNGIFSSTELNSFIIQVNCELFFSSNLSRLSKTSEIHCFSFRNFTVGYSRNFLSLPSEFIKSLNANKFMKLLWYTYFFSLNETQHKGIKNLWKIDWQIILKKNCHCFCNSQCPRNRKIVKLICELGPDYTHPYSLCIEWLLFANAGQLILLRRLISSSIEAIANIHH